MRSSRSSDEHQAVVSRRLALLSAELAAVRESEAPPPNGGFPADEGWAPDQGWSPDEEWLVGGPGAEEEPTTRPTGSRLPVPGRHAARRRVAAASASAAASGISGLRSRWALGPAQVSVIAVLVAVGLAVSCWWLLRSEPEAVGPTAPAPVTEGLVTPADVPDDPAASPTALVVDVAGRVRRPGIAVLDPGARVVDALEAAGGARPGVDLSSLNLARALVDGEQILVGVPAPRGPIGAGVASGVPPPGGLVNLNTADLTQLEALPEVGPVTAQAIIGWREEHGGFSAVDELLDVDGIGEATLSQLAPLVTV